MEFTTAAAPHLMPPNSVAQVMRRVIFALLPAVLAYTWFFGFGLIINILIACTAAIGFEATMLKVRGRTLQPFISDYSALITGMLLAFALPPLTPWWITVTGVFFAIVFAKHLYGGLGFNPFNPAMVGYVVLLVAFPQDMTFWIAPSGIDPTFVIPDFGDTLVYIVTGSLPAGASIDAISQATPLDDTKTQLSLMHIIPEIRANPIYGDFGGRGWEWINNFIALGGFWLLYKKVIRWHIPVGVIFGVLATSTVFYMISADTSGSPGFHLFGGATLLCAFFIATDPVSAATSNKGRFYYGLGIGILICVIRKWGIYPDGVAFAVLLMNLAVPLIDKFTIPRTYGHEQS